MKFSLLFCLFSSISFATSLQGNWKGKCETVSQGYLQAQLSFSDNHYQILTFHSASSKCDDRNIKIETSGTFAEADWDFSEGTPVNYLSGATFVTPLSGGIAFTMNIAGLCGITNWKANQKKEVSGKVCDGKNIPKVGQTRYDLYGIDESTLFIGKMTKENDGQSEATRPLELDTDSPYTATPPTE